MTTDDRKRLAVIGGFTRPRDNIAHGTHHAAYIACEAIAATGAYATIDTASALYVKPVKCLQRAIVATWYLRLRGYACVLVVGAHVARKEGHAWVEAGGQVLGDPRRLRRFFRPLAKV